MIVPYMIFFTNFKKVKCAKKIQIWFVPLKIKQFFNESLMTKYIGR